MNFKQLDIEFTRDVLVVGDLHGVWRKVNSLIAQHKPSVVLQVGDFGWWPRFNNTSKISTGVWRRGIGHDCLAPKMESKWQQEGIKIHQGKLYFCPGNHEDWTDLDKHATSFDPHPVELMKNVFYMPKCTTLQLPDGRTVLFMGGASSIDRAERSPFIDWFPQELITLDDVDALPNIDIDIVISHACPTEFREELNSKSKDWRVNDSYWTYKFMDQSCHYLSKVLDKYNPKYWFFGHYHTCATGKTYDTRWFCLNKQSDTGWWTFLPKE